MQDIDIHAHPEEHPGEPDKFKLEWDKFQSLAFDYEKS